MRFMKSAAERHREATEQADARWAASMRAEREAAGAAGEPAPSPDAGYQDRGVTSTGPEDITVSGQALGEGSRVTCGQQPPAARQEPGWQGERRGPFVNYGAVNNGVQNTGGGRVTLENVAMGQGEAVVSGPAPEADLEAGS